MAWVAGADVTVGDLITAATWNNYLGASGDIDLLKIETDKLDDVSQGDVTGSRAIDGTTYQNTSDKIRFVTINVTTQIVAADGDLDGTARVEIKCDSNSTPTTVVANIGLVLGLFGLNVVANSIVSYSTVSFKVAPDYYYKATETEIGDGAVSLLEWFEWDLH